MFEHAGFFLLRRPLRSVDLLYEFHKQLAILSFEDALRNWFEQDLLAQEAIYLASPDLYKRFMLWMAGEVIREAEPLQVTLYKYLIRMSMRATPFGLFAGCAVGRIGATTDLTSNSSIEPYQHTQFDGSVLAFLKTWIVGQPILFEQLALKPNSGLYSIGQDFRYFEILKQGNDQHYFISTLEHDIYINVVLQRTKKEGCVLNDLIDELEKVGVKERPAREFICELIENEILVFQIEPNAVGGDYLARLLGELKKLSYTQGILPKLQDFQFRLNQKDNRIDNFKRIESDLNEMGLSGINKIARVDSFFSSTNTTLAESVVEKIQQQLASLYVLSRNEQPRELADFKLRFQQRYDSEEIPLCLALDPDLGIGYGLLDRKGTGYSPIIDEVVGYDLSAPTQSFYQNWYHELLLEKLETAGKSSHEIILDDRDLAYILKRRSEDGDLPLARDIGYSLYAIGNLFTEPNESTRCGDFHFNLTGCGGPSALSILGRFAGGDSELENHLSRIAKEEEAFNPEVILAEVVHTPDPHLTNILTRPSFYRYEIPYLGNSVVNKDFQISVDDLLISIKNGRIELRSKKLNKRVIPKSSNSHNYRNGLPIYRFLSDIQVENSCGSIKWDWGACKNRFFPTVRYGNIILSRSTWIVKMDNVKRLNLTGLSQMLKEMQVPQRFLIVKGDNELLIEMDVDASLDLLLKELIKVREVRIVEFLFGGKKSNNKDFELTYTHELIIPLKNINARPIQPIIRPEPKERQRIFLIGSEWLYIKIYVGEVSSDKILSQRLYPLIHYWLEKKLVEQFYFVRYVDTDAHIRLRFHGQTSTGFFVIVLREIQKALSDLIRIGVVHNIQVDTYKRELERYGMEQIETCEKIFFWDSLATLAYLHLEGDDDIEEKRIVLAIRRIGSILNSFGLVDKERYELMDFMKENFFNEFKGDIELRKRLSTKYKSYKNTIRYELDMAFIDTDEASVALFKTLAETMTNKQQRFSIVSSIIHMSLNRIFSSKQRVYELFLYHCLAKHYGSVIAYPGYQKTSA
jgi:thiopeptide-type bacteriocin biosynthesis protein